MGMKIRAGEGYELLTGCETEDALEWAPWDKHEKTKKKRVWKS